MKFLFFPNGWVLAHPSRMIEVARIVRSRGHEVIFAGEHEDPRSYLSMCREEGFSTTQCMEFDWPYFWDRHLKYGPIVSAWDLLNHQKFAPLDGILEEQIRLTEREKPDAVVCDGTFTMSTAGYITGTPVIGIMNGHFAHFYDRKSFFRPFLELWDRIHLSRLRNRVYKKYGCTPVNAVELLMSVRLISPSLDKIDPYTRQYPNWEAVGPFWGTLPLDRPKWLDSLDDGRTNVYITMGSTGNLDRFLRRTYEGLAKTGYRFVVTCGNQVSEETKAMAPDCFHLAEFAPGGEILKHCKAMIFHGGNGSMYQSLAAGVPMLAFPQHLEQEINVRLGLEYGFIKKLKRRDVSGNRLGKIVEEVVTNPSYAQAAQTFSELVRNTKGPERAADIILEVATEGIPPRVTSA